MVVSNLYIGVGRISLNLMNKSRIGIHVQQQDTFPVEWIEFEGQLVLEGVGWAETFVHI